MHRVDLTSSMRRPRGGSLSFSFCFQFRGRTRAPPPPRESHNRSPSVEQRAGAAAARRGRCQCRRLAGHVAERFGALLLVALLVFLLEVFVLGLAFALGVLAGVAEVAGLIRFGEDSYIFIVVVIVIE